MVVEADGALRGLIDREGIRELGLLYSRAVDRGDVALLRTLYTADATDTHGDTFDGPAEAYCDFIAGSIPHMRYSGHHVCNHLIALTGPDEAEGEIYAVAVHVIPDGDGGWAEDIRYVRYIDRYRRSADGRWRFAKRVVTYDHCALRPIGTLTPRTGDEDPSYALVHPLFARGARR